MRRTRMTVRALSLVALMLGEAWVIIWVMSALLGLTQSGWWMAAGAACMVSGYVVLLVADALGEQPGEPAAAPRPRSQPGSGAGSRGAGPAHQARPGRHVQRPVRRTQPVGGGRS